MTTNELIYYWMLAVGLVVLIAIGSAEPVYPETLDAVRVCDPAQELPEHRKANWSRTADPIQLARSCWYEHPGQSGQDIEATISITPGMKVDPYWRWRARHGSSHWWLGRVRPMHRGSVVWHSRTTRWRWKR